MFLRRALSRHLLFKPFNSLLRLRSDFARWSPQQIQTALPTLEPRFLPGAVLRLVESHHVDLTSLALSLKTLETHLPELNEQGLAELFTICQQIDVEDHFWVALCSHTLQQTEFSPNSLATMFLAVAHRLERQDSDFALIKHLSLYARQRRASLEAQDITDVLTALAQLDLPDEQNLIREMCVEAANKFLEFTPPQIADTLDAISMLKVRENTTVKRLLLHTTRTISKFDATSIAKTLTAMVKLNKDWVTVKCLCDEAVKQPSYSTQDIVMFFHSLSRLRVFHQGMLKRLCANTNDAVVAEFASQDVAIVFGALERFELGGETLLIDRLCARALEVADQMSAENIARTLHAMGKLRVQNDVLVARLYMEALNKVAECSPYAIVRTLGYMVKYGAYNETLMKQLCAEAVVKASTFSAKKIGQLFQDLSRLATYDAELISRFSAEVKARIDEFSVQDITKIITSLAKLHVRDESLVKCLCVGATNKTAEFTSAEIMDTLRALSELGVYDETFVAELCVVLLTKAATFDAPKLTNTLLVLANLGVNDGLLVGRLCEEAMIKLPTYASQDIARTLLALAKLECIEVTLPVVKSLCMLAKQLSNAFTTHDIANTLTALEKLRVGQDPVARELGSKLVESARLKAEEFSSSEATLVLRAMSRLELTDPELSQLLERKRK